MIPLASLGANVERVQEWFNVFSCLMMDVFCVMEHCNEASFYSEWIQIWCSGYWYCLMDFGSNLKKWWKIQKLFFFWCLDRVRSKQDLFTKLQAKVVEKSDLYGNDNEALWQNDPWMVCCLDNGSSPCVMHQWFA